MSVYTAAVRREPKSASASACKARYGLSVQLAQIAAQTLASQQPGAPPRAQHCLPRAPQLRARLQPCTGPCCLARVQDEARGMKSGKLGQMKKQEFKASCQTRRRAKVRHARRRGSQKPAGTQQLRQRRAGRQRGAQQRL